jgi:hypothetical protein
MKKCAIIWKWNNLLLNNQWIKEKLGRKIFLVIKSDKNGNTTCQYLSDSVKALLRKKFEPINTYITKAAFSLALQVIENQEQTIQKI